MESTPIPVQLLEPWIIDNHLFLEGLERRKDALASTSELRPHLAIRAMYVADPVPLCAVDAAVVDVRIGDMLSILIQVVRVADSGHTVFGVPIRLTGVNGTELSLARTPLRVAAECNMLAESKDITIADTSFWSMLMEVNQVITRRQNGGIGIEGVNRAYQALVSDGLFLQMLRNPSVIAMSKTSQACRLTHRLVGVVNYEAAFISDRELLGQLLVAGEFLVPALLTDMTTGKFGIEERGFLAAERAELRDIFERQLGVTYFKPHAWARALRIEASLRLLQDDTWLMPLLTAIQHHTQDRTAEPWPQFMADWNTKHVAALTKLYGPLNFHRTPFFDPARTL